MHGAVEFYLSAKKAGLIPILGAEIFVQASDGNTLDSKPYNLVLLAENTEGYHKLLKIVSSAYVGSQLEPVPTVPLAVLKENSKGLIALSSSLRGEFAQLLLSLKKQTLAHDLIFDPKEEKAVLAYNKLKQHVHLMKQCFSENRYYVELIDNNLFQQKMLLADLVQAAEHFSLPIVATAHALYLDSDFSDSHALLTAIKNNLTLKDIRSRIRSAEFHLASDKEMHKKFSKWPTALSNTMKIAKLCSHVEIKMDTYYLPKIAAQGETPEQALRSLAKKGLEERFQALQPIYGDKFDDEAKKQYWQRLEYEISVIVQMGFPDYFLIVQDFIAWAKTQKIPVGPGRGSGAGSLVAYALQITDLDPIPYNLIFERFLNPERVSMPDFDIDFCQWRREEVIQYCVQKYGNTRTAQITTFGKMQAKAAVKSVGRALNLIFNRVDRFTKLFPPDLGITLEQALAAEPRLKEEMAKDEALRECMDYALNLEGLVSHTSVHAAGVVISDSVMTDYVPVYTTDGRSYITQYEMKPTEKVGLVKFDFLGLKTLTVVDKAVEIIKSRKDPNFDISKISLKDSKVFELLSVGKTCGIFQCESLGMTQLILKLQPNTFEDIIALVALFRPGPLGSGMVDDFIERKHGRQKIEFLHPDLEPILRDTYGMILYQEQVQKIASILASAFLGEADLLRRAMGKKIPEEMAKQKNRFLEGCEKNKVDLKLAEEIFELMAEFAKYGFNKSHSAAYGLISYQTAYLKTYYPAEFLAASMTCDKDNTDKIKRYIEDCNLLGIEVLKPNINRSELDFDVPADKKIGFALSAIKGIGEEILKPLLMIRKKMAFLKAQVI